MGLVSIYPGSFDPITNGHIEIIERIFTISERLVIAVCINHDKQAVFSVEERVALIEESLSCVLSEHVHKSKVTAFEGLVVDIAMSEGAVMIVRGLRDTSDVDKELRMSCVNSTLAPSVQTVFFPSSCDVRHISSSAVRGVAELGGDVSAFVPAVVALALNRKFWGDK